MIYIKTNSFNHFSNFKKMFFFLKQGHKILAFFLLVEDNTEDIWNKPIFSR